LTRKHQNHPCLKGLRSHGTQDEILKKTSQKNPTTSLKKKSKKKKKTIEKTLQ
jgi:hypothetical protein